MRVGVVVAIGAALVAAAPTVSAEPTYGEGAELVEEVRDRGILQSMPDPLIVDTLRAICDSASALAPYGATVGDLAGMYVDGYGLSWKDATWLIETSLPKCD